MLDVMRTPFWLTSAHRLGPESLRTFDGEGASHHSISQRGKREDLS